jgi:nitrate reductase NapAB chaperone NapD
MIISGVLFETLPGRTKAMAMRLAQIEGLEITGSDGHSRLAAVWRGPDGRQLEREAERLLKSEADIIGIYPTFVGTDSSCGNSDRALAGCDVRAE